jgi:hypothetical protein
LDPPKRGGFTTVEGRSDAPPDDGHCP